MESSLTPTWAISLHFVCQWSGLDSGRADDVYISPHLLARTNSMYAEQGSNGKQISEKLCLFPDDDIKEG